MNLFILDVILIIGVIFIHLTFIMFRQGFILIVMPTIHNIDMILYLRCQVEVIRFFLYVRFRYELGIVFGLNYD